MPELLDLPNCTLLVLLNYLDATSLYSLSRTCLRFSALTEHSILWRRIDARASPNDPQKMSYCLDKVHRETHTALFRGDQTRVELIVDYFYFVSKFKKYEALNVLALENQTIKDRSYTMIIFPQSLQELSLKKTMVVYGREFFRSSNKQMINLRTLILDECHWLNTSAFLSISRYEKLEILSLYKCKNLDNSIPYLSISGQYGFKNLKVIDVRLSVLGNTLIRSLHQSQSVLGMYFQCEDISYKLDYFKRKLEILHGIKKRDLAQQDNEFDINDTLKNEKEGWNHEVRVDLDDKGLLDYISMKTKDNQMPFPSSTLYLDPYDSCHCDWKEKERPKKTPKSKKREAPISSSDDSDDDDDDIDSPKNKIRQVRRNIKELTRLVRRSQQFNSWSRGIQEVNQSASDNEDLNDSLPRFCEFLERRNNIPNEQIIHISNLEIRKRLIDVANDGEPERKRPKAAEEAAGPSRAILNGLDLDDSSSDDEAPVLFRPPTPHPDAELDLNEECPVVARGAPIVRIIGIQDILQHTEGVPLRRLSLRGYKKITNAALMYLRHMDLEILDLTYTSVSVHAIEHFLVEHPSCRIVHEAFCTCPTNLHF